MKKVSVFFALYCFFISGAYASSKLAALNAGEIKNGVLHVSAKEASELLANHQNLNVLDVRTKREHEQKRIESSINIDYFSSNFTQKISQLDKNDIYIVHCKSGNRSGKSVSVLRDQGFKNIIHLDGGISAWTTSGLKTLPESRTK